MSDAVWVRLTIGGTMGWATARALSLAVAEDVGEVDADTTPSAIRRAARDGVAFTVAGSTRDGDLANVSRACALGKLELLVFSEPHEGMGHTLDRHHPATGRVSSRTADAGATPAITIEEIRMLAGAGRTMADAELDLRRFVASEMPPLRMRGRTDVRHRDAPQAPKAAA